MVANILLTPNRLKQKIPLDHVTLDHVNSARQIINNIVNQVDNRLLMVIGPCSIHDSKSALDYALKLKKLSELVAPYIFIVMRVYLEKPRTTTGWQGLIKDPNLDNSFDFNKGLTVARELLYEINSLGLPTATEFLDPLVAPYIADLMSWGAIGARTSESQVHRNLASGLNMSIGFKNATSGDIKTAVDALIATNQENSYLGIDDNGHATIIHTDGNCNTHLVLRGGSITGPNFEVTHIQSALATLSSKQQTPRIMIDCSHGNSQGNYKQQIQVLNSIQDQLKQEHGHHIIGVMLESFIEAGNQSMKQDLQLLEYGKSITDGCINWTDTENLILQLAAKIKATRFAETHQSCDELIIA